MRLKLDENNKIIGYGAFENIDYPEYNWTDKPEIIIDEYNQPLFYWDGEKPVYSPIEYTDEQTKNLRKAWCKEQIAMVYPSDKESQILRENMNSIIAGTGNTEAYMAYNMAVQAIIAESKEKDFQITTTEDVN